MSLLHQIFNRLTLISRQLIELISGQEEIKRLVRLGTGRTDEVAQQLAWRLDRIESLLNPPVITAPEPITAWRLLSERKDNEMFLLTYEADLPPVPDVPENADVVTQRIKVLVDGVEASSQDLPKLAAKVTFEVPKGKTIRLTRSLVDDDDNEGDSVASQDFVAKDTIRPSAPGDFGEIRNIGEREVPDET